jgi:transcriptional regulator with XRE-family HTH domain
MLDREQQLIEAAMRYLAFLEDNRAVSIGEFVTTVDPALRDELRIYLEQMLALGEPQGPMTLTAHEMAMADQVAARVRQKIEAAQPQSLTNLRRARKLSISALAKQINLPPDLLQRIERGGVRASTIPNRLVGRLAHALGRTEAAIQAAFGMPQTAVSGTRLSAKDGTVVEAEDAVSFAEALQNSAASAEQRAEWE